MEEPMLVRARKREFREITDALSEAVGIRLVAVGRAFGVSTRRLARWRDETGADGPPDCWRETLANLVAACVAERRRQVADGELLVHLLRPPPEVSRSERGASAPNE